MQLGFFRGIAGRVCFSSFLIVFAGIFSARSAFCSQLHPPFLLTADVVSTPSAGGPGRFIWAVTPECAADCATLEVKVEMPGGIQVYLTSQTLAFAAGKTVSGFFDFTPPVPGRYEVTALVAADLQGFARFADAKQVLLDVPEQGPATVATRPNSRPTDARIPANLCSTAKEPAVAVTPVHLSSTSSRIQVVFKYERYTAYPVAATPPLWVKEDAKVIRFADVEIDGPAGLVRGLSTDASGKITATYPAPSLQGVKIRLFARMKDVCAVESVPFFGWNYTGHGDVYSIEKDASEINGTVATILKGSMASGPWAILDTIIDGWQYAKAIEYNALRNSSLSVPMVYARWQHGYAGASDYSSDLQLVRLDGGLSVVDTPAQFNRAIILHEYAHHLSHTLSTDKSTGTSDGHTYLTPLPPPTAWSEGWATFFSRACDKTPVFYYFRGSDYSTIFAWYNIESPDLNGASFETPGSQFEMAVAASLWDVFDSAKDCYDTASRVYDSIAADANGIWTIFRRDFSADKNCDVQDFYNAWKTRRFAWLPQLQDVMLKHGMRFEWGARVTEPDGSGLAYTAGKTIVVRWTGFSGTGVRIELVKGDGDTPDTRWILCQWAPNVFPTGGLKTVSLPTGIASGPDYRIVVRTPITGHVPYEHDESNSAFTVNRPLVGLELTDYWPFEENPGDSIVQEPCIDMYSSWLSGGKSFRLFAIAEYGVKGDCQNEYADVTGQCVFSLGSSPVAVLDQATKGRIVTREVASDTNLVVAARFIQAGVAVTDTFPVTIKSRSVVERFNYRDGSDWWQSATEYWPQEGFVVSRGRLIPPAYGPGEYPWEFYAFDNRDIFDEPGGRVRFDRLYGDVLVTASIIPTASQTGFSMIARDPYWGAYSSRNFVRANFILTRPATGQCVIDCILHTKSAILYEKAINIARKASYSVSFSVIGSSVVCKCDGLPILNFPGAGGVIPTGTGYVGLLGNYPGPTGFSIDELRITPQTPSGGDWSLN